MNFVSADEAKELIAEGYTVIDVRDKSQYDRAHIKSCYHVPLFIENQDNDIGKFIPLYQIDSTDFEIQNNRIFILVND